MAETTAAHPVFIANTTLTTDAFQVDQPETRTDDIARSEKSEENDQVVIIPATLAPDTEPTEPIYPSTTRLVLLTAGVALVVFAVALDNTIIATAIPTITSVFDSLDDVGWYGSAYLLTTTSLQPTFGKIYATYSAKRTYLFAIILFEVGSIICAVSTSSPMLIFGRAVAGTGAAGLFSGGLTIIGFSVPPRQFPMYISVLSSMYGVASVIGPILGGALTVKLSWRWCFWINLPFGGIAFLTVLCFFKAPNRKSQNSTLIERLKLFDIFGTVLLVSSIVCLFLALQWGGTTQPWSASLVWGLLVGFALLFILFCVVQWRRGDNATIPPRLFVNQRTTCSSAIYAFLLYMGLYCHIYFLPFYFQAGKGSTAEQSGIRSVPYLVSMSLSAIVVGVLVTKIGHYVPCMLFGAAMFAVGGGLLFTLRIATSTGAWVGYQIIAGTGIGIGSQLPYSALQGVLSTEDMPLGNAIIMFFITLGGSLAIPISQTILTNALIREVPKHSTNVDVSAIIKGGATVLGQIVPADQLNGVRLAYVLALDEVFIVPIVAAGIAFIAPFFVETRGHGREKSINDSDNT